MKVDPHSAERFILIGCHDAMSGPTAMRLHLHPEERAQWYAQALAFLNDTVKYDSTTCTVFVQPDYRSWPQTQAIVELVSAHYKQARLNQHTVEAIGARQGTNFVRNLKRVMLADERMRDLRQGLTHMTGQTCVIVGAGVSLEESTALVRLHRGPIIAVNTSAGACAQGDVHPDVVVCTESKPVVEGIARMNHSSSHFAMDMTGHPDNWPDVENLYAPNPLLCFVNTEPNLIPYAQRLGMLPLAYGSSCTTAAVSMALSLGADRVLLVGQDCSFRLDAEQSDQRLLRARMYASGCPYEETTVAIDTIHKRALIEKPTVGEFEQDVIAVPGHSHWTKDHQPVGVAWTTHGMLSFANWFRDQPEDVRKRIVNCTASGAIIDGIEHAPLRDCIDSGRPEPYRLNPNRQQLEAGDFRRSAGKVYRHLQGMARHGRTLHCTDAEIIEWSRRHPILGMWTAPERLRMRRLDLSMEERGHRMAAAIRQACRDIVAVGEETDGRANQPER